MPILFALHVAFDGVHHGSESMKPTSLISCGKEDFGLNVFPDPHSRYMPIWISIILHILACCYFHMFPQSFLVKEVCARVLETRRRHQPPASVLTPLRGRWHAWYFGGKYWLPFILPRSNPRPAFTLTSSFDPTKHVKTRTFRSYQYCIRDWICDTFTVVDHFFFTFRILIITRPLNTSARRSSSSLSADTLRKEFGFVSRHTLAVLRANPTRAHANSLHISVFPVCKSSSLLRPLSSTERR